MTTKAKDYAALTTKEEKAAAIKGAKSEGELDAMWKAWESSGWSRDGLLYAQVLARKKALGAKLSEGDIERLERAAEKEKAGKAMPAIKGDLTLGRN